MYRKKLAKRVRDKLYKRRYRELKKVCDKYLDYFEGQLGDPDHQEDSTSSIDEPNHDHVEFNPDYENADYPPGSERAQEDVSSEGLEESEASVNNVPEPGQNLNIPVVNIEPMGEELEIQQIREWAVLNRIKNNALDGLLKILGRRLLPALPKSAKTLLKTSRASYTIQPMNDSKGRIGEYVYIGVKKQILKHINPDFHEVDEESGMKLVEIDVNVDGLKVFKSSEKDAWVISARIVDKRGLYKTFTIAVYYGQGKPANMNLFVRDFVREIITLSGVRGPDFGEGFTLGGENYRVRLR